MGGGRGGEIYNYGLTWERLIKVRSEYLGYIIYILLYTIYTVDA